MKRTYLGKRDVDGEQLAAALGEVAWEPPGAKVSVSEDWYGALPCEDLALSIMVVFGDGAFISTGWLIGRRDPQPTKGTGELPPKRGREYVVSLMAQVRPELEQRMREELDRVMETVGFRAEAG